ncbi:phospho-N-acetylmuramoyl-pentapeptide-transferase [bacterium]|nr:phospho-N-acetylmuramoyl-pentapeptide-transferase [bacterium]
MFYYLLKPYWRDFILFNLFKYVTFRVVMSATTGFIVSWLICGPLIKFLKKRHYESVIREDVPERHLKKRGTPTMGGIAIITGIVVSTLLWAKVGSRYIIMALVTLLFTGFMGFVDDYLKDVRHQPKGLLAKYKLYGQFAVGLTIAALIFLMPPDAKFKSFTELPFIKDVYLQMGVAYIIFSALVVVASSNAVNISDGLDGLAAGLVAILAATFTVVAYVSGRGDFTTYLNIVYLKGSEELAIFCAAMSGATLGFLWYNSHPAEVFMGDTGALSLGASIGAVSIMLKKEFLLLIAGGVFVIETLSVIAQVAYFRTTGGRRIFKMAPLHHHCELSGWYESKIVVRFWILGIIFALLGLVSFKVR